jgi:hypothetical protein
MALEWFEPDLLLSENPDLCPLWMDDYSEFVLELRTNFSPYDPVSDAEHQLRNLFMSDSEHMNKYMVDFNRLACQVRGYGDGALRSIFYNGLPDRIKDDISRIGKPPTLSSLRTLAQDIDARFWERKLERERHSHFVPQVPSVTESDHSVSPSDSLESLSETLQSDPLPNSDISDTNSDDSDSDLPSDHHDSNASDNEAYDPSEPSAPLSRDLASVLGPDGRLSAIERQRRFDLRLCFYCGLDGHTARDCPKSVRA